MHRKRISKEKYIDVTLTKSLKNLKDRTDADLFGLVDLILRPFSKKVDRKKERKLQSNSVITNSMGPANLVRYNRGSL
jgi:hypothetical protein